MKAVTAYLNSMVSEMLAIAEHLYFTPGYDQAVHNKLLWLDHTDTFESSQNGDPLIATLHYSSLNEFDFDDSSGLSIKNGGPVKIVHQYDRNATCLLYTSPPSLELQSHRTAAFDAES